MNANELKKIGLAIKHGKPNKKEFLENYPMFRLSSFNEHTESYKHTIYISTSKVRLKAHLTVWFDEDDKFNGVEFYTEL